jgi:hypothetical protein
VSPQTGIVAMLRAKQGEAENRLADVLAIVNANHRAVPCDCSACLYLDVADVEVHETVCDRCAVPYPCSEVEQVRAVLDEPREVLGR